MAPRAPQPGGSNLPERPTGLGLPQPIKRAKEITSMSDRTPHEQADEQPVSIAAAIAALLGTMPGVNAPASERAAWFDTKAAVLERIATAPRTATDEVTKAAEMARHARQAANTIREREARR